MTKVKMIWFVQMQLKKQYEIIDRIIVLIPRISILPLNSIPLPAATFLTNLIVYYGCERVV